MRRRAAVRYEDPSDQAAGVAAILVLGDSAAYALSVVDPGGVIHGCVTNAQLHRAHVLLVRDTGRACGEERPSWTGISRARRLSGARSGSLDVIQVTATNNTGATEVATCPTDHPYLVGGGLANGGTIQNQPETTNGSINPNAWSSAATVVAPWKLTPSTPNRSVRLGRCLAEAE